MAAGRLRRHCLTKIYAAINQQPTKKTSPVTLPSNEMEGFKHNDQVVSASLMSMEPKKPWRMGWLWPVSFEVKFLSLL